MAAPIMALAKLLGGRAAQEKTLGYMTKLYKGIKKGPVTKYGEKLSEKGYVKAYGTNPITGKKNLTGKMYKLPGKKAKFQRSAGKAIRGIAKKGQPIGSHLKKYRKEYTAGATGAVLFDIFDDD